MQDFLAAEFTSETPIGEAALEGSLFRNKNPAIFARGGAAAQANRPESLITYPAITVPLRELEVSVDAASRTMWCYMNPCDAPSFTPSMVRELKRLHTDLCSLGKSSASHTLPLFYVMGSRLPGIYNLGGDLAFLLESIRAGNKAALTAYAHGCVEAVHAIYTGFDAPIISVGLVQGNALGGGLEGALCYHTLVAERGVRMGFPEVLFGSFPGMGAYSFLTRKIGAKAAHDIITSGRIYSSEEFYEMGIVDVLAAPGQGKATVEAWITENSRRHPLLHALNRARYRVNPIELAELRDVTNIWVDTALALDTADLRRMELLLQAQRRQARQGR